MKPGPVPNLSFVRAGCMLVTSSTRPGAGPDSNRRLNLLTSGFASEQRNCVRGNQTNPCRDLPSLPLRKKSIKTTNKQPCLTKNPPRHPPFPAPHPTLRNKMPFSEASNRQVPWLCFRDFWQTTKRNDAPPSQVSFGYSNIFQYQTKQLKIIKKIKIEIKIIIIIIILVLLTRPVDFVGEFECALLHRIFPWRRMSISKKHNVRP